MIDFEKINGVQSGRPHAFEELICQLAHLERPANSAVFRRVEGAGGDGGVECYWLLADGTKIGYQAKYFLRTNQIDWAQIDKSVQQAIITHPTLIEYVVALPCDLTDRAGVKRKGKTGWQNWESHREKWQKKARHHLKRIVKFTPWTKSELLGFLTAPGAAGLSAYFFGEVELSSDWFKKKTELATAALEDRYHAEDHVDVAAESTFEFMIRHPNSRATLKRCFQAVRKIKFPLGQIRESKFKPPDQEIDATIAALAELVSCEPQVESPPWEPWQAERWNDLAQAAGNNLAQLLEWAWEARENLKNLDVEEREREKTRLNLVINEFREIDDALRELTELLGSQYLTPETARAVLIEGRAGTGKSQLLARVAEVAVAENRPVILLLGQQLRNEALWPQILQRLGLPSGLSADEFLARLDAAAESQKTRCLILIDAVNEGAGSRLWMNEIASFLAQVRPYSNLACALTCRSEYVRYVVPAGVLEHLPRIEIRGFETPEEQENAARVYLDRRGISRPSTPWLAPEFVNPLFLRSCCNALQKQNQREFPRGLVGTKKILAFFLESVARHLGAGRDGSDDLINPTKASLVKIAGHMAKERKDHLSRERAEDIADRCFELFAPPADVSWLEVLQRNGLLRFDPDPDSDLSDPLHELREVARFSFQRFQDHLMAEALLAQSGSIKEALNRDGSLAFIHDGNRIHPEWQGLTEALSIQVPERFKIELADALPGEFGAWWRTWAIRDAFWQSLRWRDKEAFAERTLRLFNGFSDGYRRAALLIELSASIDHPWNAHLIHQTLIRRKMPDRDKFWCGGARLRRR